MELNCESASHSVTLPAGLDCLCCRKNRRYSQFWQVTITSCSLMWWYASMSCSLMWWYAGMSCSLMWRYASMHVDCSCCFSFRWISVLNNAKEEVLLKAFHDTSDSHSLNQSVRELTSSIVDRICKLPGNKYCCDCDAPGWG